MRASRLRQGSRQLRQAIRDRNSQTRGVSHESAVPSPRCRRRHREARVAPIPRPLDGRIASHFDHDDTQGTCRATHGLGTAEWYRTALVARREQHQLICLGTDIGASNDEILQLKVLCDPEPTAFERQGGLG